MKDKLPIRVNPGKGRHPVETRVFAREIHESFCAMRGCRFFGKHAAQGVCFSTDRFDGERVNGVVCCGLWKNCTIRF